MGDHNGRRTARVDETDEGRTSLKRRRNSDETATRGRRGERGALRCLLLDSIRLRCADLFLYCNAARHA